MNYYRNDIRHVKGDTYSSAIVIEGLGQTVDSIYFTCRENLNDNAEILFQSGINNGISMIEYDEEKDIRKYAVRISPSKTRELQSGTYYYDLEVRVNSDVFTVMKGKFILEQDSTREDGGEVDPLILVIKNSLDEINGETISVDIAEKLDYLRETKELIKDSLNALGTELSDENSFRGYVNKIDDLYNEWPKLIGEGTSINLTGIKNGKAKIGLNSTELTQDGTPTPDTPQDIHVITGSNNIKISDGTEEQNYPISLADLEYCKIGDYADQLFKNTTDSPYYDSTLLENEWYLKKNINKTIIDSNNASSLITGTSDINGHHAVAIAKSKLGWQTDWGAKRFKLNSYNEVTTVPAVKSGTFGSDFIAYALTIFNDDFVSSSVAMDLLIGTVIYNPLATPQYIHISETDYPTLRSQLENLYNNAKSYNGQTYITQTNDDLPFNIELTALMKGDE